MWEHGEEKCKLEHKQYFNQSHAKLVCADYHRDANLLLVGFSNGVFSLYEMPHFNMIHSLRYA